MKKLLFTFFTLLIYFSVNAQMCNTTPTNMGVLTPTGTFQNVAANSGARRYWTFNATAGCTYDFSTCLSAGTNDTYIRIYSGTNPLTAVLVAQNDDGGPFCAGTKASISWVCPTTGAYSILVTNWSCVNISANSTLSYRVTCSPPYDPCTNIQPMNCGVTINTVVASGNGAYNPPNATCGFSTPGREYIYSFTPTLTGNYFITQPTSFGYIDYFFRPASTGCGPNGWTCIDDITNGNIGNLNFPISLTAGVTYYIMLDPETTGGGTVSWNLICATPPTSNDNCTNATVINSIPYTSPVLNNFGSTDDIPAFTSNCGTMSSNVWYRFTGTGTTVTVSTCNPGTNFDTEIRIYTGGCAAFTAEETCNDDDISCGLGGLYSTTSFCAEFGVDYYISVGYWISGGGFGNFVLSVIEDGVSCGIFPVELIHFDGRLLDKDVLLEWKTESENGCDYFEILRSEDSNNWKVVGKVHGAGFSNQRTNYELLDRNVPYNDTYYYRLNQVNYDGSNSLSNIVLITMDYDKQACINPKYYDLSGKEVLIDNVPAGVYIRRCEEGSKKIIKY